MKLGNCNPIQGQRFYLIKSGFAVPPSVLVSLGFNFKMLKNLGFRATCGLTAHTAAVIKKCTSVLTVSGVTEASEHNSDHVGCRR